MLPQQRKEKQGLQHSSVKEVCIHLPYAEVQLLHPGIILFGESMALFRLASVALIIAGLVGLKVSA